MAFQEDFREFLDVEQGFAVEGVLTPTIGISYKVKGILVNDYYSIDVGEAGIVGSTPTFECAEDEAGDVEYGDLLTVKNERYRVVGIKPDGTGWLVLELERQN